MAKDSRDAVVSVRISEEEQAKLKDLAASRRTSVSNLVRSAALREVTEVPVVAQPAATSSAKTRTPNNPEVVWTADGAVVTGGTITVTA